MTGRRPTVAERERGYARVWGRACAQVFHQTNAEDPHVDVYRYAPTWRFWAPARDLHVYVTGGMADREMPVAADERRARPRRVELCAYAREVREAEPGRDAAAWALHTLAHVPWRESVSFMPLETVAWGGPLLEGSAMAAFFFVVPPVDGDGELSRAAEAEMTLQVMTITAAERGLAVRGGSVALIDRFEAAGVPPLVDWRRASCV